MSSAGLFLTVAHVAKRQSMERKLRGIKPEDRMEAFRRIDPELARRIPEEYLRSYLGI